MEYKSSTPQTKAAGEGKATVVIATLGVKDRDGDVLLKGAFGKQIVSVVPAHDWKSPAIGKATIREEGNEAIADIDFYLSTDAGKNWYHAIKEDFERPPSRQQYSWGFQVPPGYSHRGKHNNEDVRFLHASEAGDPLPIAEVSPVLMGAGQNTRSVSVKETDDLLMNPSQKAADGQDKESRGMGADAIEQPAVEPTDADGSKDAETVEDYTKYPEDRRPPLPLMIKWLRMYRYHMPFLQDIRKRDKKEISPETIGEFKTLVEEAIEVATQLRIAGLKADQMPSMEEEELLRQKYEARSQELYSQMNVEQEREHQKQQAKAAELANQSRAREAQIKKWSSHE